jgi:hypothetical protein
VNKRPLPLNDRRWRPWLEAHARLVEVLGSAADQRLTEDARAARLRFKRIWPAPAGGQEQAELVLPPFWDEHRVASFPEGAEIIFRTPQTMDKLAELHDCAFFVWLPDYKNIFGNPHAKSSPPEQVQEVPETRSRTAEYDYPKLGDELALWLGRNRAVAGLKSFRQLAFEFEVECETRGRKAPGSTQLRAYVTNVVKALRTPPKSPKRR